MCMINNVEPNDYFGRKVTMITCGVLISIGGIIQTASFFAWQVMICVCAAHLLIEFIL